MQAVLGMGSNLGNREQLMAAALSGLEKLENTGILKLSSLYETEPFDVLSNQDNYLNCCVLLETGLSAQKLLESCLELELELGRQRKEYHGARTMDIDLLLYEGFSSCTPELTVPHPHILERAFVMVPLSDLFPDKKAWDFSFEEAFEKVDKSGVLLYK